jgi:3'-5' exoribonuclease
VRIVDLEPGSEFDCVLLVARKELRQGGRAGYYLDLTLCDPTGRVAAKVWDNAASMAERFEAGDVVRVSGMAETYRNELQLRLQHIEALAPDEAKASDFLPQSQKDPKEMESRVAETVKSLTNPHLKELLLGLFHDQDFRTRFRTAPGAKALHHAYIGGLLEHTVEVVELCERVAEVFPELDRDLLMAAAILHDIGKMEELSWTAAFDYTDEGNLVGHLVLGDRLVQERANGIEGFPKELKLQLSHLILSHHGTGEFGSPKAPMTAEAIALHHAEDLDAKVNMFLGRIREAREKGQRWTERHFLLGRPLYAGEVEPGEAEETE